MMGVSPYQVPARRICESLDVSSATLYRSARVLLKDGKVIEKVFVRKG